MRLHQIMLLEGGNIFSDVSPILRAEVAGVISTFKSTLPSQIQFSLEKTGSAGFKEVSGDIDMLLDEATLLEWSEASNLKSAKAKLLDYLKSNGLECKLSGVSIHVKVPNGSKYAQVDLMVVQNASEIAKFHNHAYDEMKPFKGAHKHIIISSLAKTLKTNKFPYGLLWSPFQGLFTRKQDGSKGELVSKNIDEIAKILLGSTHTGDDLRSPQSIIKSIPKDKREARLHFAREDLGKQDLTLPEN